MKKSILALHETPFDYQLHPTKYPWAWDIYLKMLDNNWHPREIPMTGDVSTWRREQIPPPLAHAFLTVFSQLTTFDFQRAVDINEVLLPLIQAPEIKQALIHQAAQEALHTYSYQFCIENLGLDPEDIYTRWRRIPILQERVKYANKISAMIQRSASGAKDGNSFDIARIAAGIAFWFLAFEGVWFMLNLLGPVQAMARHNFMRATAEQFQYIARDESLHVSLGTLIVRNLLEEELLTESSISIQNEGGMTPFMLFENLLFDMMQTALRLEEEFIEEAFPLPWLGYTAKNHSLMAKWLINKRMLSIGLQPLHDVVQCPIPWLAEMMDLKKEKNFFETRITEYRTGNALFWDPEDD